MLCHNPFDFKGFMSEHLLARTALAALLFCLTLALPGYGQQTTLGGGTAGESAARLPDSYKPPTGPAPRLPNGRVDFSGVWDHPYVPDMSRSSATTPRLQTGAGDLPYTPAGLANITSYDPAKNGDYTGMCMPFGFTRSVNSPYPLQIMQSDTHVAFLFEQNSWFHVVPFRPAPPDTPDPTWFGTSIAKWDGDTLVVETAGFNGFTRLDTKGNPHSDRMKLTQRFTRTDAGHISYVVTIDDPVYYTKPWTNQRTFTLTNGNLLEYSCEENNRSMWEGRIKLWVPPSVEQPRIHKAN
jgi:hypothetical protein